MIVARLYNAEGFMLDTFEMEKNQFDGIDLKDIAENTNWCLAHGDVIRIEDDDYEE